MPGSPQPPLLDYQAPDLGSPRRPSPLAATLLCLPGLLCWVLLADGIFGGTFPGVRLIAAIVRFTGLVSLLFLWGLAVLTALVSLGLYLRPGVRRPWYVRICLLINITGLLFTAFVFAFAYVMH